MIFLFTPLTPIPARRRSGLPIPPSTIRGFEVVLTKGLWRVGSLPHITVRRSCSKCLFCAGLKCQFSLTFGFNHSLGGRSWNFAESNLGPVSKIAFKIQTFDCLFLPSFWPAPKSSLKILWKVVTNIFMSFRERIRLLTQGWDNSIESPNCSGE